MVDFRWISLTFTRLGASPLPAVLGSGSAHELSRDNGTGEHSGGTNHQNPTATLQNPLVKKRRIPSQEGLSQQTSLALPFSQAPPEPFMSHQKRPSSTIYIKISNILFKLIGLYPQKRPSTMFPIPSISL